MWEMRATDQYGRRLKQFSKKHRRELLAMLDNLDTYLKTLQSGVRPLQVQHGFLHTETHGAIAIDQKGAEGKPTQTRLYAYPDSETEILHLITIGDKKSQREDNATCREFIVGLREEKQKLNIDQSQESTETPNNTNLDTENITNEDNPC
ncbi:MAG: hypothetical protein ACRC8S_05030 [Fimbriiglobus sp.]